MLAYRKERMDDEAPDYYPWNWPSPIPRYWAYSKLFKSKLLAKVFEHAGDDAPERVNPELPFVDRYWHYFWSVDPTQVADGLFLGSAKNAADSASLESNEIATVVNATTEIDNFFEGRHDKIQYVNVALNDTRSARIENVEAAFVAAVEAVDRDLQAGKHVLVHCFMGASRSVALVCAYLMKYRAMTLNDAYQLVQEKRPCAALNHNFHAWLEQWQP